MNTSRGGALAVAALAVAVVGRSVLAEPPPAMEQRDIKKVIDALAKEKGHRAELASVRFYADVFDGKQVAAPIGSSLTTLGAWSDNGALMAAESSMNCAALPTGEKLQKASALAKEFGDELAPLLRAYTLAAEGKKSDAVTLIAATFASSTAPASCPSEHPMYSYRRSGRLNAMLNCIKALEPAREVKKLQKEVDHAQSCAMNNHAVG